MTANQEPNIDMLNRLRALIEACGPTANKHDLVTVLISACIEEGMDTAPEIHGVLKALEFNPRHAAILLKEGTGTNPERHLWRRDGEGRYRLLEAALA